MAEQFALEAQADPSLEHWPTPAWVTEALLQEHPPPTGWVVEPSAGDGALAEVLSRFGHLVCAYERREECWLQLHSALAGNRCHVVQCGIDWMDVDPDAALPRLRYSVVMNPPYRPAAVGVAHLRHALESRADYVAALLPLSWLSGSEARRRLYADHGTPSHLYGFAQRPKFAGAGGQFEAAWFVWDRTEDRERFGAIKLLGVKR